MNNHLPQSSEESFKDLCTSVQLLTGLDDTAWYKKFKNDKGLYGMFKAALEAAIGKDRVPAFKNGKIIGNHKEFSSNMADSAVFGSGYNTAKFELRNHFGIGDVS